MAWKNNQVIKRMAIVELSKKNNFQVNLNSLGLGKWNKDKIDYYVTIKKMNLTSYSGGYILKLEDIGVTDPVYKIKPSRVCGNFVKESLFYDTTNRDPNQKNVVLPKDVFMFRTFISGNGGKHSIFLTIEINGKEVQTSRGYGGVRLSKVHFKNINEEVTVSGRWNGYMSGGYRFAIWVYRMAIIDDDDASYSVVFFEKE